ncbi:type IV pilus biogenesis protein PilM [Isobaculum melis]|uniref:Type IV pilus assembly protein PilM n=1 Tax=Isobaculum melis TaxID=142588 RepID=A0A1H9S3G8_9LACT|nr:pilus assembly protein PilM [Isobaculum melis]SER79572.1 type IV pilus assembly protein PilM [Isobaculum melis]
MFGKKKDILGIDIQKNVVRYCMLHNGKWKYGEKIGNGSFFKDNGVKNKEALREILHDIFAEIHIRSPHIVISVLNSKLLIRQIPLRDMGTEKEIREFLFFELGESIPLPFEEPIFDLLILDRPTPKKQQSSRLKKNTKAPSHQKNVKIKTIKRNRFAVNGKVPVVITSEPLLEEIGDTIQKGGGHLSGVDFSALAYTRALKRNIQWGESFALVEIDSGEATITIFEKFVPIYVQYEAYNQVNWRYQEIKGKIVPEFKGEMESLTQLGETIRNLIHYFESEISLNSKVSRIYLVGGHPHLKREVSEIIQKQNSIPVSVPAMPYTLRNQKTLPHRFLLAASLSMKEV